MSEITRVGVDLAKRVIQVHAVDAAGRVVAAKALAREKFAPWCAQLPPGWVAMESCSGAHHWARKLCSFGLDARLIAAHLVTPYRMQGRGGKSAGAIRVSIGLVSNFADIDKYLSFIAGFRDQTALTIGTASFDIESCRVVRDGS